MRSLHRLLAVALLAGLTFAMVPPAWSDNYVSITGSGSTWSQVAVDAWRADVRASGVVVNFSGNGSTAGRSEFIQGSVDFANTEIPFQNPPEPGQQSEVSKRPFAYVPVVAGGTSFMYNLTVGGKRVRDLRLSPGTLAKIFTGKITRWNDPAVTADYGHPLPDIAIIPVVRSDGAGASAQFTKYMASQAADVYCPFIQSQLKLGSGCPSVSFYPAFGASKAQVGSNGVANYVSASYGQGAIGYVEYAYAKRINFPVASLLNKGGYYAQPTPGNVAVALTKAQINADLTQNLDSVYTNPDPRTYPMSSYSYMVVPTDTTKPFNADKGKTLTTFINYFLCKGQQKAAILGYSPLPKNLVLAGFDQVRRIPGAVASPSIGACANPALQILTTAPQPDKCSKQGATCSTSGVAAPAATSAAGAGAASAAGAAPGVTTPTGPAAAGAASVPPTVAGDPLAGGPVPAANASTDAIADQASSTVVSLASQKDDPGQTKLVFWLAALALVLAVVVPPVIVGRLRR